MSVPSCVGPLDARGTLSRGRVRSATVHPAVGNRLRRRIQVVTAGTAYADVPAEVLNIGIGEFVRAPELVETPVAGARQARQMLKVRTPIAHRSSPGVEPSIGATDGGWIGRSSLIGRTRPGSGPSTGWSRTPASAQAPRPPTPSGLRSRPETVAPPWSEVYSGPAVLPSDPGPGHPSPARARKLGCPCRASGTAPRGTRSARPDQRCSPTGCQAGVGGTHGINESLPRFPWKALSQVLRSRLASRTGGRQTRGWLELSSLPAPRFPATARFCRSQG